MLNDLIAKDKEIIALYWSEKKPETEIENEYSICENYKEKLFHCIAAVEQEIQTTSHPVGNNLNSKKRCIAHMKQVSIHTG